MEKWMQKWGNDDDDANNQTGKIKKKCYFKKIVHYLC